MVRSGLSQYVRAQREARGLSLRVLANQAGVSKSTLHAWESGIQQPSLPELDALLLVYGADADERARVLRLVDAPRAQRELLRQAETALGAAPAVSGDLLRALRIRRGLSVAAAAQRLLVQPSTVLRWERGETWPSAERIAQICAAVRAHSAERTALLEAGRILAPRPARDLAELDRTIAEFRHWSGVGTPMPLVELRLVGAMVDLWPMIPVSPSAEELYRQANVFLGCWMLIAHGALEDAAHYAERAIAGDDGTLSRSLLAWPVHILAKNAAYGSRRHRPSQGARLLSQYRSRYEGDKGLMAWYQRDLAGFYGDAGDLDAAIALSTEAQATTRRAGDPTENADFDHAKVLMRTGRYDEALRILPEERTTVPLQDAQEAIAWAEVLVAIGDQSGAERNLRRAREIVARQPLVALGPTVEALSLKVRL